VPFFHESVLLAEAVTLFEPGAGKVIVDGTLGGGGHAEALLQAGADVVGVDRDPVALTAAKERLARFGARFASVKGNFGALETLLDGKPVDGVLLDLGVSSPQLDDGARGFSFQRDAPLDMRMGDEGPTAAQWIAEATEGEVERALREYGEERFAGRIARELVRQKPQTTLQAAACVERAVPRRAWPKRIHVATRTFQALRMAVNGELEALDAVLAALPRVLRPGGVAAIISFHSLEDRKVKHAFRDLEGRCTCPPGLPVCACGAQGSFVPRTKGAVMASEAEIERNPRARSARLRAVEKIR
jgi:16S rRNA (cytosine1402-N4)-methyltransferase